MKSSNKLKPNLFDLIPAAAVIALAVCLFLFLGKGAQHAENGTVIISSDGEAVQEISLASAGNNEAFTFSHNGITLTLTLNPDGEAGVQITASDCPNGDCIRTGRITRSGESIVCLPARTVISLQGGTESGVDAVIG